MPSSLMHHFPTVKELLETVLRQRDDDDMTAIRATLLREYQHPTLLDLADTVVRYYAARPVETRNFDALEAKAVLAEHPAHEFFAHLSGYSTHRIHQTACSTRLP